MDFVEGVHFIGAGDDGNRTVIELSRIYEGLRDALFNEGHDKPKNHLHIHSFPSAEPGCFDCNSDSIIILAGAVHDPCWKEARKTLNESRPYFMLTIGIDSRRGIDSESLQPFPNECLVFPEPPLLDPVEVAQLALQIFFIHTPWNMSARGSLIGYDPDDTKAIFSGKVTQVRKMTSDKDHYRQNFSSFLSENKADFSRAQGILMSLWGRNEVLSIPKANDLWDEMKRMTMPDATQMLTFHILPDDGPDLIVTIFLTF